MDLLFCMHISADSNVQDILKGDSGSLVIDINTTEIYGHVVASNPFGEVYVVPLDATLGQVKELFATEDVSLPEPLYFETSEEHETRCSTQSLMTRVKSLPHPNEANISASHLVGMAPKISSNRPSTSYTTDSSTSRATTGRISTLDTASDNSIVSTISSLNDSDGASVDGHLRGISLRNRITSYDGSGGHRSSVKQIFFRISDISAREVYDVEVPQPDRIRRWSLKFRNLMDEGVSWHGMPLKISETSGFDATAVACVLEYLQRGDFGSPDDVELDPQNLARLCSVLWTYKCAPDMFRYLGKQMQPKSSRHPWDLPSNESSGEQRSIDPSSGPSAMGLRDRRTHPKYNCSTSGHLITVALVLRLQDILEEELKVAVWSTNGEVETLINLDIDIQGK